MSPYLLNHMVTLHLHCREACLIDLLMALYCPPALLLIIELIVNATCLMHFNLCLRELYEKERLAGHLVTFRGA